jgi:hypothetical protein
MEENENISDGDYKPVRPWDMLNPNEPRSLKDVAESRMDICKQCDFLNKTLIACKKCGCFMIAKTRLEKARCPIGKW